MLWYTTEYFIQTCRAQRTKLIGSKYQGFIWNLQFPEIPWVTFIIHRVQYSSLANEIDLMWLSSIYQWIFLWASEFLRNFTWQKVALWWDVWICSQMSYTWREWVKMIIQLYIRNSWSATFPYKNKRLWIS